MNKIITILQGTVIVLLTSIILGYIGQKVGLSPEQGTKDINTSISRNYLLMLLPLLISPVIEEMIFRKWLPNAFSDVIGRKKSIVFSNTLFAFFHFNLFFIPFLVNGLIYSYYYEKTKDIKIPIFIHISYNGIIFLTTFIV